MTAIPTDKLEKLRKPFDADEIEKLPKYVGQKDANGRIPKSAYGQCEECGRRHPLPAIHLDYVGHAGITDRLNDVDPEWNWEPVAFGNDGLPLRDQYGGMWIRLTVLGITRYGYGDAQGKTGPNAVKETIGDAIRNAAMRFGVATYLWSKSEKAEHMREFDEPEQPAGKTVPDPARQPVNPNPHPEKPKGDVPRDPRKPLYDRVASLKHQAIENGVLKEGIDSWYASRFGDAKLNKLDDAQMAELLAYLEDMVSSTADGHLNVG